MNNISPNIRIMTLQEFEDVKTSAFQKGYLRGRGEPRSVERKLKAEVKTLKARNNNLKASVVNLNTCLDGYWNTGPNRHEDDDLIKAICDAQQQCKEVLNDG